MILYCVICMHIFKYRLTEKILWQPMFDMESQSAFRKWTHCLIMIIYAYVFSWEIVISLFCRVVSLSLPFHNIPTGHSHRHLYIFSKNLTNRKIPFQIKKKYHNSNKNNAMIHQGKFYIKASSKEENKNITLIPLRIHITTTFI